MEGDAQKRYDRQLCFISIHALRVEGDITSFWIVLYWSDFYPRPPGGGRLLLFIFLAFLLCISIHALRVEGDFNNSNLDLIIVISIHALRVEGDSPSPPSFVTVPISIHALRVEGDSFASAASPLRVDFYPRPPGGGRLEAHKIVNDEFVISIHALRVEGDWSRAFPRIMQQHFYPRPPGGGRHKCQVYYNQKKGFLSTPSGWRATEEYRVMQERGFISIHALRVEGDR